ncbi:MAG: 50S ribosomal protein L5 [Candidatus Wildermuthbacteria bacterium]|nr:50S ribosomal protein L5 [Candidatus Wildermuthbacteria bacterium]MBI2121384.1 50S ribosomal protein L5 [Candidatus Wildermuthbacteria bacterium]MBI2647925.1 50S ribosomal protein L5 [Candidatus Wildermuthbacteria bacterium]
MNADLKTYYTNTVVARLQKEYGIANAMAVPAVKKIVVNAGFGKIIAGKTGDEERKLQEEVIHVLSAVTGQKPLVTKAHTSIAGFKLREGAPNGAKVTLRGKRMWDFLTRFISIVLPRSRDFRGLSRNSLDQKGNCTVGIREHIAFPELAGDQIKRMIGFEVTIMTSAKNAQEGRSLLEHLGFPFKKS